MAGFSSLLRRALAERLARGESRAFATAELRGLPMDEASRMARAAEMFPETGYRGVVGADMADGNPIWVTPDRKAASGFADRQAFSTREADDIDLDFRTDDEYSPQHDDVVGLGQNIMPLRYRTANALDLTGSGQSASLRDVADDLANRGILERLDDDTLDEVASELATENHAYSADHAVPIYRALEALGAYRDMKIAGYDAVRITDTDVMGNPVAATGLFSPSQRRSLFAAFDPSRTNRRDLLAGLAVAAPTGALTLREALRDRSQL